jgi:hypothetical protein
LEPFALLGVSPSSSLVTAGGAKPDLVEDGDEQRDGDGGHAGRDEGRGVLDPGGEDVGLQRDPVDEHLNQRVEHLREDERAGGHGERDGEAGAVAREEGDGQHDRGEHGGPQHGHVGVHHRGPVHHLGQPGPAAIAPG